MTRVVIQLRCIDQAQKDRYKALAASENLGLSEWIRKRCEDGTQAPVASQGHARAITPHAVREALQDLPKTPAPERPKDVVVGLCSRTGFPVEACLCPQCKKSK